MNRVNWFFWNKLNFSTIYIPSFWTLKTLHKDMTTFSTYNHKYIKYDYNISKAVNKENVYEL
jgi:hypothetical protein